jgi:hypothetical protein
MPRDERSFRWPQPPLTGWRLRLSRIASGRSNRTLVGSNIIGVSKLNFICSLAAVVRHRFAASISRILVRLCEEIQRGERSFLTVPRGRCIPSSEALWAQSCLVTGAGRSLATAVQVTRLAGGGRYKSVPQQSVPESVPDASSPYWPILGLFETQPNAPLRDLVVGK